MILRSRFFWLTTTAPQSSLKEQYLTQLRGNKGISSFGNLFLKISEIFTLAFKRSGFQE